MARDESHCLAVAVGGGVPMSQPRADQESHSRTTTTTAMHTQLLCATNSSSGKPRMLPPSLDLAIHTRRAACRTMRSSGDNLRVQRLCDNRSRLSTRANAVEVTRAPSPHVDTPCSPESQLPMECVRPVALNMVQFMNQLDTSLRHSPL